MIQITAVPSGHISNIFLQILPHLMRLAPRTNGRSTVDDILKDLLSGDSSLWLAFEPNEENSIYGVVISKVVQYPRCKMLNIYYCAGNKLSSWQDPMFKTLISWAKDNNCVKIEFTGRPGWYKVLKKWNPVLAYHTLEIDIK